MLNKEVIEKLKEFPDDSEILCRYFSEDNKGHVFLEYSEILKIYKMEDNDNKSTIIIQID